MTVYRLVTQGSIEDRIVRLHRHVVLVRAQTIVAYRRYRREAATQWNIITGASGTTDIEGSLVLGAHGPRYLHVIVALG